MKMDPQEVDPDSAVEHREGNIINTNDSKALNGAEGHLCNSHESNKTKKDSSKKAKKSYAKHARMSNKAKGNKSKKVSIADPHASSSESTDDQDAATTANDSSDSEVEILEVKKKTAHKKRRDVRSKNSRSFKHIKRSRPPPLTPLGARAYFSQVLLQAIRIRPTLTLTMTPRWPATRTLP